MTAATCFPEFQQLSRSERRRYRAVMKKRVRETWRIFWPDRPPLTDEQAERIVDVAMGIPPPPEIAARMRRIGIDTAIGGETEFLRHVFLDHLAATGPSGEA